MALTTPQLKLGTFDFSTILPFTFTYDGQESRTLLAGWQIAQTVCRMDEGRELTTVVFTDPATGLRVTWEITRFADFPVLDWVLYFENTGADDTPIIADVQALDIVLHMPFSPTEPYRLHRTNGAPSNPQDFTVLHEVLQWWNPVTLDGGGGRSSNKDLPFFKLETGAGSLITAVGWSGQWQARLACSQAQDLHLTAGLELTHFCLHPGERVRTPSILLFQWEGDTLESNAQFRQLIYRHYAAKRNGQSPLPTLFCNTCFTRGGGWLNECNAENQISLIKAYAPLGLEALITDAGWFEGGWPDGAGNWDPRADAYPDGMAPVAAAALEHGMVYGLWFEPERVHDGTGIDVEHPEWVLRSPNSPWAGNALLDFGLPEVQDYFFHIVKRFMDLPGFCFYRQDFNIDPLVFWRDNDAEDRQGITEMKYIMGLYAFWERIADAWPDSIREECASGGRRIDLETIKRMHIHQDSDYWFDNETDQSQIWGLSQYLPNNCFTTPINRLDDYSFHSALATSLCMGWIADAPDFDVERGKALLQRYLDIRHLLIGAWYPLLPDTRSRSTWMGFQFHRPDLNEGLMLLFRRPESPYPTAYITLHGLDPAAVYELVDDATGTVLRATGEELMDEVQYDLPERGSSEMVVYRRVE